MRWYFNDASLQGQFTPAAVGPAESEQDCFELFLRELMAVRPHIHPLRVTRLLPDRLVRPEITVRAALQLLRNRDLKHAVLVWFDRSGPFVEDDRLVEADDLFMFSTYDVTDSGLGEAARRVRTQEIARTFSVSGGASSFSHSPLVVTHGLPEAPLGHVPIDNVWSIDQLRSAAKNEPSIENWKDLVIVARRRYGRLIIPDAVYLNKALASEPFSSVIASQALAQLGYLDAYMSDRGPAGEEGAKAREIYQNFFVGANALFTGESDSNMADFATALTFPNPDGEGDIFAHWHGKIRHRVFRLHFEFPVPQKQVKLRVVYLGPKLTKT